MNRRSISRLHDRRSARALGSTPLGVCAASLVVSTLVMGCSFINDFPEVVDLGNGGGGSGGGGGGVCAPSTTIPQPELQWYATRDGVGINGDYTEISGLVRRGSSLLAWGINSNGLVGFPGLPAGTANRAFLVDLPDGGGAKTMLGTLVACDVINGSGFGTGRMALIGTEPLVTGAMTGAAGGTVANYGFARGFDDPCVTSIADPAISTVTVPFSAYNGRLNAEKFLNEQVPEAKGYSIDIATNGERFASIGVGFGTVKEVPLNVPSYYLLSSTQTASEPPTVLSYTVEDPPFDSGRPQVYGGVAVDGGSNIWVTGKSCGGSNPGCFGKGSAFIDWLPPGGGPVRRVTVSGSIESFGSVVRAGPGAVVVGGGYRGELTMGSANFPPSPDNVDAFVVAINPTDQSVRWTYPSTSAIPVYERGGFDAVVDLAVVPDPDCGGFVYVAGCQYAPGTDAIDCRSHQAGTGSFVAKLRLDTGEEVWSGTFSATDLGPEMNPRLIPSAVAADASGFWVAYHFTGQLDFPSNGLSRDAVIYKFAP